MTKTVLTVDDSRTMRDMLLMALEDAGYTVIQAVDGVDGLETLAAKGADVVITDINMPRMDGFGFIEGMRADPNHRTTPVLVLTTESDAEKKARARAAGATGWIVKPFDPAKLVDAVRRVAAESKRPIRLDAWTPSKPSRPPSSRNATNCSRTWNRS